MRKRGRPKSYGPIGAGALALTCQQPKQPQRRGRPPGRTKNDAVNEGWRRAALERLALDPSRAPYSIAVEMAAEIEALRDAMARFGANVTYGQSREGNIKRIRRLLAATLYDDE